MNNRLSAVDDIFVYVYDNGGAVHFTAKINSFSDFLFMHTFMCKKCLYLGDICHQILGKWSEGKCVLFGNFA